MIILDIGLITEVLKPNRDRSLIEWLDMQSVEMLHLTATGLADLLIEAATMTNIRRRSQVSTALDLLIARLFSTRILPFDHHAALAYYSLSATAQLADIEISRSVITTASIASVHGFTVATKNVTPFEQLGVKVVGPWKTAD